jgi:hypothetical protein
MSRTRTEALLQISPIRLPNWLGGNKSFLIDRPSAHGGAQICTSATPKPGCIFRVSPRATTVVRRPARVRPFFRSSRTVGIF